MNWDWMRKGSEPENESVDVSTSSTPTLGERLRVSETPMLLGPTRFLRNAWGYEPRGPNFYVEVICLPSALYEEWNSLEGAVARFADLCLPQWAGGHVGVVDSLNTRIVGYGFTHKHVETVGPYGWWYGTKVGFELLARYHDNPMEVAVWETIAKEWAS